MELLFHGSSELLLGSIEGRHFNLLVRRSISHGAMRGFRRRGAGLLRGRLRCRTLRRHAEEWISRRYPVPLKEPLDCQVLFSNYLSTMRRRSNTGLVFNQGKVVYKCIQYISTIPMSCIIIGASSRSGTSCLAFVFSNVP